MNQLDNIASSQVEIKRGCAPGTNSLRLCVKPSLIFILDKYNHIGYTPQHLLTRRSKGSGTGKASLNPSFAPPRKGQSTRSARVTALGAVKPKAKLKPRRKRQTGCLRRTLGPGSPPNLLAAIQGNSLFVPLARHDQPRGSSAAREPAPLLSAGRRKGCCASPDGSARPQTHIPPAAARARLPGARADRAILMLPKGVTVRARRRMNWCMSIK